MAGSLLLMVAFGAGCGYLFMDASWKDLLDTTLMDALYFMIVVSGINIGSNKELLKKVATPYMLALSIAAPLATLVGSLVCGTLSSKLTGLSMADSLLVSSGLGWYSLSSVVISTQHSTELGTIAFLSNMLRELSAFVLIPILARFDKLLPLAPGGAGTMDSLLPMVIRSTDMETGLLSFMNGLILSLIVPVLLSILL